MSNKNESATIDDPSMQIARALFAVAKASVEPGTALWLSQHQGRGHLRSQARFIRDSGEFDNKTITSRDTAICNRSANLWLKSLAGEEKPLWKMLLAQSDSEGNFNIVPIYPDDPRLSELDFDGDALEVAHRILSE